MSHESLFPFGRRVARGAFYVWCKTPRWLALSRLYCPLYRAVGYRLDELGYEPIDPEWTRRGR